MKNFHVEISLCLVVVVHRKANEIKKSVMQERSNCLLLIIFSSDVLATVAVRSEF